MNQPNIQTLRLSMQSIVIFTVLGLVIHNSLITSLILALLLGLIILTFRQLTTYIKHQKQYKTTQFYKVYGVDFHTLLKKEKGYFHYFVYTELLKRYADHAELFNQLTLPNTRATIDLLLLHKSGVYALNLSSTPMSQTVNQLSNLLNIPIKQKTINESNFTAFIHTLDHAPSTLDVTTIHTLYDTIEMISVENA